MNDSTATTTLTAGAPPGSSNTPPNPPSGHGWGGVSPEHASEVSAEIVRASDSTIALAPDDARRDQQNKAILDWAQHIAQAPPWFRIGALRYLEAVKADLSVSLWKMYCDSSCPLPPGGIPQTLRERRALARLIRSQPPAPERWSDAEAGAWVRFNDELMERQEAAGRVVVPRRRNRGGAK